jgi:hypothetical protein
MGRQLRVAAGHHEIEKASDLTALSTDLDN